MSYIIRTVEINAFVEQLNPIVWTTNIDSALKFESETDAIKNLPSGSTNLEIIKFDSAVSEYGDRKFVPDWSYIDNSLSNSDRPEDHNVMPDEFELVEDQTNG